VATYDRANEGDLIMRRVAGMVALIGLGVLLGFLVRLVWPREETVPVYVPPVTESDRDLLSAGRTAG
jgi:hypothetical protein